MKENVGFELPGMNVKGEYTIQLFDENGELVKEEKKHNCINKIIYSNAYYNHIFNGIIENKFSVDVLGGNDCTSGYLSWLTLCKDSESVEGDVNNPVIIGECIGYADTKYLSATSDTMRGILNINESCVVENYVDGSSSKIKSKTKHLVFDFSTDKANGAFDNVYLSPFPINPGCGTIDKNKKVNYSSNSFRGYHNIIKSFYLSKNGTPSPDSTDGGAISHDKNYLYIQCLLLNDRSKCYDTICKISFDTWDQEYITLQVPTDNSIIPAYILQGGGYFWRIEYNWNCTRYNMSGEYVDNIKLSSKFSTECRDLGTTKYIGYGDYISSSYYHSSEYRDFFTGDDEYLYIAYRDKNNPYKKYICSFDKAFNKISENYVDLNQTYNQIACLNMAYVGGKKYLLSGGAYGNIKCYEVKNDGKLEEHTTDLLFYLNNFCSAAENKLNDEANKCISFLYKNYLYKLSPFTISNTEYPYNAAKSFDIATLIPWTSHVKLDSPITKTSANTMKIQYDITCEYVPVGGIENIE